MSKQKQIQSTQNHLRNVQENYLVSKYGPFIKIWDEVANMDLPSEDKAVIFDYLEKEIDWSVYKLCSGNGVYLKIQRGEFYNPFNTMDFINEILEAFKK